MKMHLFKKAFKPFLLFFILATASNLNAQQNVYEGVYVIAGSTPRVLLVKGGEVKLYLRKYDDSYPLDYYWMYETAHPYTIDNGKFTCDWFGNMDFQKSGGKVTLVKTRHFDIVPARSLADIIRVNEWQARPIMEDLVGNEKLSQDKVKELLTREDLYKNFELGDNLKFSVKDLALNFIDGGMGQVEKKPSDFGAFEGVYAQKEGRDILVVKEGYFRRYLFIENGENIQDNYYRYNFPTSSREAVKIVDAKYKFNRDREYGQFQIKEGKVIGVRDGVTEQIRLETMADLLKNLRIDARDLLQYLVSERGMSADQVKKLVLNEPIIDQMPTEDDQEFLLIDLIIKAAN
ncbi:MAG: hypothetical protein Roseis2KO_39250 [Roseivirga sp.]